MSTSGAQLLPQAAVSALKNDLLPQATIVTPNVPEAKLLLGRKESANPQSEEEMIELAKDLHRLGPTFVLVKGGHFQAQRSTSRSRERETVDAFYDGKHAMLIRKRFLKSKNTHGTGCSLACTVVILYTVPILT